ncbi:hypothetical protein AB0E10_07290 [Streptomyces sp. NPDC048045]|uniref:hypothetical protein n=1 Tax=Streptomyces sp. NPDC048045 TaxID=3154710 RepID=UPI003447CB9D
MLLPPCLSAAPSYAADRAAPYVELTPDSGQVEPGGSPLALDATFHNTLDTDITNSFIVAVGIRLAPPAARLSPAQVVVEWFDAGPSVWRPVKLTPGETALSGYLSTDAGLPSVGSLPAGDSARISLRVSLASGVPAPATLQFVAQGLIQPTAASAPATLMDGKASYTVVDEGTGTTPAPGSAPATAPGSATPGLQQDTPVSDTATPDDSPSTGPSSSPPSAAAPGPGDGAGDRPTDSATSAPIVAAGVAALVFAAGVTLVMIRRGRRGRH